MATTVNGFDTKFVLQLGCFVSGGRRLRGICKEGDVEDLIRTSEQNKMKTFPRIQPTRLSLLNILLTFYLITGYCHETSAQVVELSDAADWLSKDNFQYYFSKTAEETSNTWHSARAWCMTNSADLASIESVEENDFIVFQVNLTGYQGSFWTGLNRLQSETTWSWTDGAVVNYTNWEATFPVDNAEMPWKCGYSQLNGLWKNKHCDSELGYVCKRPVDVVTTVKTDPPTASVPGYCPAGYFGVVNSNKCFRIVRLDVNANEGVTWDDAAATCRAEPGISPDIACIADTADNNAIMAHLEDQQYGLWIGLRSENYSSTTFKWSDNSALAFINWGPGEPLGSTDPCVEMWMSPGPPGTWNNIQCNRTRGYICQTFKDPAFVVSTPSLTSTHNCPGGYTPYWYACYKLYTEPKAWSAAEAQCIQDGGQLTSIHSESENAAVTVYLSSMGSFELVWIGLEYLTNESVYYWSDNWHVIYTKWAAGQPNRTVDGGGCVGIDQQGTWRDSICSQAMPFVCKITTETPNTTPAQKEGTCPTNASTLIWFPYGEHCYGASNYYTTSNWEMAQETCVNAVPGRSCNLISIHNSLEGEFVADLVLRHSNTYYDSFWIGLHKGGAGMSYTWIDNTEVEYTYWNPGEPNNVDGTQNCVRSFYKNFANTWDDFSCATYLPFVCKVEKAPLPTTPPTPSNVDGVCPSAEWVSYGGDCYLFRPDMYVTWDEADQDCKAFGSLLVTIFNENENWFVHRRLLETSWLPFVRQFWIGLSKLKGDDKYLWSNGLSLDSTNYTNWKTGSPIQNSSRLCVDLYGSSEEDVSNSGHWTTSQCDELRGYACRVAKASATAPPNPDSGSGGPNAGAIVGAVFGIIIGVGLIVGGSYFGYRWYKGRRTNAPTGVGVSNASYDNSSHNGSSKSTTPSDATQVNYLGDLEHQDLDSVHIGRLELKD